MRPVSHIVMGGDPFCDIFRGTYDLHKYWDLTDPDYCVSVMRSAYDGGCRCYELSTNPVQEMFLRLESKVGEELTGFANPTYVQGIELGGKPLQYCRSRILSTFTHHAGLMPPKFVQRLETELRESACMMFGFDPDAQPLSDRDIAAITLNEDAYVHRLSGLSAASCVLVGGTDADWLVTLGREDILARMCEIVRAMGKSPYLLCHYTSTVLPRADKIKLDTDGYFAAINRSWAYLDKDEAVQAVRNAKKPVTAFMAFACGGLSGGMEEAAAYLRDECGVSGIMFGTTKKENACRTARLLTGMFD